MYHNFLIHLSADGHLGCFHVLSFVNSAARNQFCERQFFHETRLVDGLEMIQVHYTYCALYLYYYHIRSSGIGSQRLRTYGMDLTDDCKIGFIMTMSRVWVSEVGRKTKILKGKRTKKPRRGGRGWKGMRSMRILNSPQITTDVEWVRITVNQVLTSLKLWYRHLLHSHLISDWYVVWLSLSFLNNILLIYKLRYYYEGYREKDDIKSKSRMPFQIKWPEMPFSRKCCLNWSLKKKESALHKAGGRVET